MESSPAVASWQSRQGAATFNAAINAAIKAAVDADCSPHNNLHPEPSIHCDLQSTDSIGGEVFMLSVQTRGNILVVKMIGVLDLEHIQQANDLVDEKLEGLQDALLLVDMRRYEGAEDLKTLWEEFRFVTANKNSVAKVAIIGNLDWQKLATLIVSPFTRAKEKFFEPEEMDDALKWLRD